MPRVVVVKKLDSIRDAVGIFAGPVESRTPSPVNRILIAEDRESMRYALKVLFQLRKDWEVCGEAQDAKEAIRQAIELKPDLIVMDYKMQGGDGLQAADGIFRALPDVPIVLYTLYKTDELQRAAEGIGIRCVVGKEEGVQALLSAVDAQLQKPTS